MLKVVICMILAATIGHASADLLSGFERGRLFGEQVRAETSESGVRMAFNAPGETRQDKPTTVIFYTTPNGNTIEQTLGCTLIPGMDWHFDIQHIAAQTRRLREIDPGRNYVLVCLEAEGRSWPSWRAKRTDNAALIRGMVEGAMKQFPGSTAVITGHSGGGSMITGFINAYDELPAWVTRIAYLDANYSYDDDQHHGDKLLKWLRGDSSRHLVVLAYDDREIELDGKKVVGPTGGTFRASHRMLSRLEKDVKFERSQVAGMDRYDALDGRIAIFIHRNPANKILHTALIGEMNGYLEAMTLGTPLETKWGKLGGPRAYAKWIQPADIAFTNIPDRLKGTPGGNRFMKSIADLPREEREAHILAQLLSGNVPPFLRKFVNVATTGADANGKEHTVIYQVMPDYLSVGSDRDFVRLDITPMTAQSIADAFECSLPTTKMVDEIYLLAEVKLEPKPLTQDRESMLTFIEHNSIIEGQRKGKRLSALVAGTKKDVVVTNRIFERPHRVAIYGWHKLDGTPIQPLTTVHVDWYVDYSHGIRLVKRSILVDGNPRDIRDVLADPVLAPLLSDEGPIEKPYYPSTSAQ